MKCDVITAGVGGQGVLSVSAVIAACALQEGLHVKQAEEHGMAQRGGTVVTHLRLSDRKIHSDIVPRGTADLIVSIEPLEALRYVELLSPEGTVFCGTTPVVNIPNYPDVDGVLERVRALPRVAMIDATKIARDAGSIRAVNMVMVGAASTLLPLRPETIEEHLRQEFARKGERVVMINIHAFHIGRESAACVPS
jgi:indolepyruvate ferredoxin oxidoreductase beta subunit